MNEKPNLDYIDALAAGEQEFKDKFIGILKEEFPEEFTEYLGNIKNNFTPRSIIKCTQAETQVWRIRIGR